MKRIVICICTIVLMFSLFGCEDSLPNNIINLNTETIEVDIDSYERLCERNETKFINNFFILGTYDEYINFYSSATKKDIEPLDKESGDKLFENQVILCFPRIVSYSRNFIQVKYEFNEDDSSIKMKHLFESEDDIDYPCVVVSYCFDLVKVNKDICNKIVYNIALKCEHDFNKVIINEDSDSDIKKVEETCKKCGYKRIGYITINPIVYSISIVDENEFLKDISSYSAKANKEIIIETIILIDADIEVLVNGVKIEKDLTLSNDDSWFYKFIMPKENVTVEIKAIAEY